MGVTRNELVDTALGVSSPDVVIRGGSLINVLTHEVYLADILIKGDRIAAVCAPGEYPSTGGCRVIDATNLYLAPGFMDPHFHIESSSITVSELAKLIVPRGVTMVAEDPHEIANVLGMKGIELLFDEGRKVPLNFMLRVPGRVPAMGHESETSGNALSMEETQELLTWPDAVCLAGDINPTLILTKNQEQYQKIDYALHLKKEISGQSPQLFGKELNAYVAAGPEDSHVSSTVEEVHDILRHGLRSLITHRPKHFEPEEFGRLAKLIKEKGIDTRNICLTTDDTHANLLIKEGHLEYRMRIAIDQGIDPITVIQMVTINVAEMFHLSHDYGSITPGRFADIVLLDDLNAIKVAKVLIKGQVVAENGKLVCPLDKYEYPQWAKQTMHIAHPVSEDDLKIHWSGGDEVQARVVLPSQPKDMSVETLRVVNNAVLPDPSRGISSFAVVERHKATGNIGKGFFKFPLLAGAYASSMNHDAHNIFVIGTNFTDMALAVNQVAANQGGYVAVKDGEILGEIAMPIAGLLSEEPYEVVAAKMEEMEQALIHKMGCKILYRPFYYLNLYCLPNIPEVGMTDKGLILSKTMSPIDVIVSSPSSSKPDGTFDQPKE